MRKNNVFCSLDELLAVVITRAPAYMNLNYNSLKIIFCLLSKILDFIFFFI